MRRLMTLAVERVLRRAAFAAPAPIHVGSHYHGGSVVVLNMSSLLSAERRGWICPRPKNPDSVTFYDITDAGRDALALQLGGTP